jgi:hypothetical protein
MGLSQHLHTRMLWTIPGNSIQALHHSYMLTNGTSIWERNTQQVLLAISYPQQSLGAAPGHAKQGTVPAHC